MTVPQIIVTLSPEGRAVIELPGANGLRRRVETKPGELEGTVLRILQAQQRTDRKPEIGLDGAPTERQVRHWERHGTFPDERCPFCMAEGRLARRQRRPGRVVTERRVGEVVIRRLRLRVADATQRSTEELGL